MTTALTTLTNKLATTLGMGVDGSDLTQTLKATAFKGQVSDAQMTALLVVANQYGLNPWTKEIYAFPDRQNGIVPVVGVDGWSRIINNHPQFDGMDFEQDAESCTCIIHRKDRGHPIKVTEYMAECRREGVGPWKSHPRRMLRHKAMIQCARLAFGYGGIFDQDEAERIVETKTVDPSTGEISTAPPFDTEAAVGAVWAAADVGALELVWKEQVKLAQAAKNKAGYDMLKQAVMEKRSALKEAEQAQVVDVTPRPAPPPMSDDNAAFLADMDGEAREHFDASA